MTNINRQSDDDAYYLQNIYQYYLNLQSYMNKFYLFFCGHYEHFFAVAEDKLCKSSFDEISEWS